MADISERYALITGASSGIGFELARLFAEDGYNLIIVGRYAKTLEETATKFTHYGIKVLTIEADLSFPEQAIYVHERIKQRDIFVDALVNDAGQANHGFFAETDLGKDMRDIQLNITSLVVLIKPFLRDMLKRNWRRRLAYGAGCTQIRPRRGSKRRLQSHDAWRVKDCSGVKYKIMAGFSNVLPDSTQAAIMRAQANTAKDAI